MRWFKVAAIVVGVMIAFLVVSSIIGFLLEAAIAVLAIAVVALAVKVAWNRKHLPGKTSTREVRGRRRDTSDVDDELARLKRESGG